MILFMMIIVSQFSLLFIFADSYNNILKKFNDENSIFNYLDLKDDIANENLNKYGEFFKAKHKIISNDDIEYHNKIISKNNYNSISLSKLPSSINKYYETLMTDFLITGRLPKSKNEIVIPYNFFKNKELNSIIETSINIKGGVYKIVGIGGIARLTNFENFFIFHYNADVYKDYHSFIRRFYINDFNNVKEVQEILVTQKIEFTYNGAERLGNINYIKSIKNIMSFFYFIIIIPLIIAVNILILFQVRNIIISNKKFLTIAKILGLNKSHIITSYFIKIISIGFITYVLSLPIIIALNYVLKLILNSYTLEYVIINYRLVFIVSLIISFVFIIVCYLISLIIMYKNKYKPNNLNLRL